MSHNRRFVLLSLIAALALAATICTAAETNAAPLPSGVKRLNIPGVHNAFAIGTKLISGGTPETAEGFATLRTLGVKTIISVDGAPPDVEVARQHGIRYVHLPCGYDGISTNRQQLLAKAARAARTNLCPLPPRSASRSRRGGDRRAGEPALDDKRRRSLAACRRHRNELPRALRERP